jgi:hypothetical protein
LKESSYHETVVVLAKKKTVTSTRRQVYILIYVFCGKIIILNFLLDIFCMIGEPKCMYGWS